MLLWTDEAWADYVYWQSQDRKTIKRINQLIKDIERSGKPEPLQYELQGFFSRRIDEKNRLVYVKEEDALTILSCRYHY